MVHYNEVSGIKISLRKSAATAYLLVNRLHLVMLVGVLVPLKD
jgi:hypothetical protein